jgi:ferritin-like metal-binding protein YciE
MGKKILQTSSANPNSSGRADTAPAGPNLGTLLLDELKDIYGAEKHQLLLLPLIKNAASSLKLRSVLAGHLDITREHVRRLEEVFDILGQTAEERRSEAMLGIVRETETVIGETAPGTATRDAGLILSAQKLEHYEIATYGSLSQLARTLEHDEPADILESILYEEKDVDDLLTSLAENYINGEASRENPTPM